MKPTRKRLVGVAAALSAVAIAAPVSTASAATAAPAVVPDPVAADWGGSSFGLPFTGPFAGPGVAVIGPLIITTAPSSFINSNTQVTLGGGWNGGQLFAPGV
jgi:hypothetical protein